MRMRAASRGVSAEEPNTSAATEAAMREPSTGVSVGATLPPPATPLPQALPTKRLEKKGFRNSKKPNWIGSEGTRV